MKRTNRILSMLLAVIMVVCLLPITAFAGGSDVAIDKTNFPDENFRKYVSDNFDTSNPKDDLLSAAELAAVEWINVSNKGISSLKGVEFFTALTYLNCSNNKLTTLDIRNNTALTDLHCSFNQLLELDVSKNTDLVRLDCSFNQLSNLDARNNTALTELYCGGNQLNSLNVSKSTGLVRLDCYENQLTSLDVSKNTALTSLSCRGNQLNALDVSKNTALTKLTCDYNKLTSLDVSNNTALTALGCDDNEYVIMIGEDYTFDLSNLPGNFDAGEASEWDGGTVSDNILTVKESTVTYTYNCGQNQSVEFKLNPLLGYLDEIAAINVTPPMPGESPDFAFDVPDGANYTEGDVMWYESDAPITTVEQMLDVSFATEFSSSDTFKEGKYYTFSAIVFAKEYYAFADTLTASVNGDSAYYESCVNDQDNQSSLWYTFYCKTPEIYDFTVTPTTLDFGIATEGYTDAPAAQTVTVTNTGNQQFALTAVLDSEDFVMVGDDVLVLNAGESATLTVQPKTGLAVGNHTAEVTIEAMDIDKKETVTVTFAVEEEKIYDFTVTPPTLDFGTVTEGYTDAPVAQTVTVTNTGNQQLTLTAVINSENFVIAGDATMTLGAGESTTFTVQPKTSLAVGTHTAEVTVEAVEDTDKKETVTVTFTVEEEKIYDFTVTPPTLDFGTVTEGYTDAPAAQTVTVTNTGNQQLALTAVIDSEKFVMVGDAAMTLGAGESTTFTVQPKTDLAVGTHTAEVTVEAMDGTDKKETVTATFTVKAAPVPETNSPQTGDNSNMALMYALLFVSGMGIVGTFLYGRKKRTN